MDLFPSCDDLQYYRSTLQQYFPFLCLTMTYDTIKRLKFIHFNNVLYETPKGPNDEHNRVCKKFHTCHQILRKDTPIKFSSMFKDES